MRFWLTLPILIWLILLSFSELAHAEAPRAMRHWHDASGHIIWRFTHDWQIVRSYHGVPRTEQVRGRYTYQVFHENQLIGTTGSLSAAKQVIAEATR